MKKIYKNWWRLLYENDNVYCILDRLKDCFVAGDFEVEAKSYFREEYGIDKVNKEVSTWLRYNVLCHIHEKDGKQVIMHDKVKKSWTQRKALDITSKPFILLNYKRK